MNSLSRQSSLLTNPARIVTSVKAFRASGASASASAGGRASWYLRLLSSSSSSTATQSTSNMNMVRLSKRMSELNICSRRQADRLILASSVLLKGQPVQPILGQKVPADTTDIAIVHSTTKKKKNDNHHFQGEGEADVNLDLNISASTSGILDPLGNPGDTIVLHKPINYVSGQPDHRHGHIPAVRLLTRNNIYTPTKELQDILSNGNYLHFAKKFPKRRTGRYRNNTTSSGEEEKGKEHSKNFYAHVDVGVDEPIVSTLVNYAPAGRLDLDSSGLLLFTKNGVIAKNVLNSKRTDVDDDIQNVHETNGSDDGNDDDDNDQHSSSLSNLITKEYYVKVEPIRSLMRDERRQGMDERRLPLRPIWDLSSLLGGMGRRGKKSGRDDQGRRTRLRHKLWNESTFLKPLLEAEWIEEGKCHKTGAWDGTGTIRMVLQEGRKRQIRRMCRELLGLHAVELKRTRIGGIELGDLPVGQWRPLSKFERESLLYPGTSTASSRSASLVDNEDGGGGSHGKNMTESKSSTSVLTKHAMAALGVITR